MTLSADGCNQAATQLWGAWQMQQRIAALEPGAAPQTFEDGYAVQARMAAISGQAVIGWKIAATSRAGQAHIAVDGPIAGRLLKHRLYHHPARVSLVGNAMRVAEAEFAFRLAADLPPRDTPYSQDEVMANVAALHPAIEVPDSRFVDFTRVGGAQLAADNACAHQFVLGPAATSDWRRADLSEAPVGLNVNAIQVTEGRGSDALGDPRAALTWLANCVAVRAVGLRAGDIVTTGVCGQPSMIKPGDHVLADFAAFGTVELHVE